MYGNYAPSGDPDNNTASGSLNINQLIELSKGVYFFASVLSYK